MSADETDMYMALKNRAQYFLLKPILADDLSSVWQYCELWRSKRNNIVPRVTQITGTSQAMVRSRNRNDNSNNNVGGMSICDAENNAGDHRNGKNICRMILVVTVQC